MSDIAKKIALRIEDVQTSQEGNEPPTVEWLEEIIDEELKGRLEAEKALIEAVGNHTKFWDDMPKGQLGGLVCNVGILNDAFLKSREALMLAAKEGM